MVDLKTREIRDAALLDAAHMIDRIARSKRQLEIFLADGNKLPCHIGSNALRFAASEIRRMMQDENITGELIERSNP